VSYERCNKDPRKTKKSCRRGIIPQWSKPVIIEKYYLCFRKMTEAPMCYFTLVRPIKHNKTIFMHNPRIIDN
jgi:hypothetical protein